ncbi:MAG: hypothetical protein CMJ67_06190 [Planctomycetaceae bacterium]|nr:hypothetical protein [Planctomycetaceae bacterium]
MSSTPRGVRSGSSGLFASAVVDRDLVLHDLLDHHLEIGHAVPIDERSRTVNDLTQASLDKGGEAESSADLPDDFIALESLDHGWIDLF